MLHWVYPRNQISIMRRGLQSLNGSCFGVLRHASNTTSVLTPFPFLLFTIVITEPRSSFEKGKKKKKMSNVVLVTGATGLLGRQVFNVFQHSGCLVVGQGFSRAAPPTILKADLEKSEDIDRLLDEVK